MIEPFKKNYLNQTSERGIHEVRNASARTATFVIARVGTLQGIAVENWHVNTVANRDTQCAEHQKPV